MADKILFDICPGWRVGSNSEQWIVQRAKRNKGALEWHANSFIGSNKSVLRRVLSEIGIRPSAAAEKALAALPNSFMEWKRAGYPMPVQSPALLPA
jgi:hypothetical protein